MNIYETDKWVQIGKVLALLETHVRISTRARNKRVIAERMRGNRGSQSRGWQAEALTAEANQTWTEVLGYITGSFEEQRQVYLHADYVVDVGHEQLTETEVNRLELIRDYYSLALCLKGLNDMSRVDCPACGETVLWCRINRG